MIDLPLFSKPVGKFRKNSNWKGRTVNTPDKLLGGIPSGLYYVPGSNLDQVDFAFGKASDTSRQYQLSSFSKIVGIKPKLATVQSLFFYYED